MHCNLRPLEPRQPFDKFDVAEPIHCRIIAFLLLIHYFTMWPWHWSCDLDFWPLTLNICSVSPVTWWNSVPNLNAIEQSAAELLRFQCLTWWHWTCFKCWAWRWNNFHQVWPSTTYSCLYYSVFWCWYVMSRCDLDLWPNDLESSWYIKRYVIKVCRKSERNRAIPGWIIVNFANFWTRYVTLWPWPLTSWPWTFEAFWDFGCRVFKLRTKFERNRIIYGWVIDDLISTFSRAILGDGSQLTELCQGWVDPTSQTWLGHRAIIATLHFCFRIRISCCIFKRGRLKVEWCFKRRKILHFWPPPPGEN